MHSLREDTSRYDVYEHQAGSPLREDHLNLKVLEWRFGFPSGQVVYLESVAELIKRPRCELRVIFAPLDIPDRENATGHLAIFEHFQFPTGFLSERIQSVSHSFGSRKDELGGQRAWFHYLCKNIHVERDEKGQLTIENQNRRLDAKKLSQADFSWIRSGFFLTSQPGSDTESTVTLICFGASPETERRFENLTLNPAWEQALQDPFILLDIVFDELYIQLDTVAWKLGGVFGEMEGKILHRASKPGSAADRIDFVGLHNISKHVIYLREGVEASLQTLQQLTRHHGQSNSESALRNSTQDSLEYCRTLFQSTQLRLVSLEKRTANLINLSFNLVTQQDSRVMQKDSSSMKTIAAMTLIFLPAGTVAAMFGSQFFNLSVDSNGVPQFVISPLFWIFWAISIPITVVLVVLWQWWYRKTEKRLVEAPAPLQRSDTGLTDVSRATV